MASQDEQHLATLLEPARPGVVRMQARLMGLTPDGTNSFHFHTWGDMTVGLTGAGLGAIYTSNAIVVEHLNVNAQGFGLLDMEFSSDSLLQHVGRSLTIHAGRDSSTPTIAAAVCGLANPRAAIDTTGAIIGGAGLSGGTVAFLVICFPAALLFLAVSCMYYHRMPIPILGKYLYARDAALMRKSIPPPPPPVPPSVDLGGGVALRVDKV